MTVTDRSKILATMQAVTAALARNIAFGNVSEQEIKQDLDAIESLLRRAREAS